MPITHHSQLPLSLESEQGEDRGCSGLGQRKDRQGCCEVVGGDKVSLSGSTVVLMVVFVELASWDDRPAKEATLSRTLGLQAAVLVRVWRQACIGASQRTSLRLSCVLFKEIHENSPIKTSSLCPAYAPTLGRSPEIVL